MKKRRIFQIMTALALALSLLCGCAIPLPGEDGAKLEDSLRGITDGLREFGRNAADAARERADSSLDSLRQWADSLLGPLFADNSYAAYRAEVIVPFEEMEYVRPDVDSFVDDVETVERALEEGKLRLREIEELIDVCYEDYYRFETMFSLADIRSCLDLSDSFYAEEYIWCGEQSAVMDDMLDELLYACGSSRYAGRLESDYFWDGFSEEYADAADSMYTPELVELMQQEAELTARYRDLLVDPVVTWDGERVPYDALLADMEDGLYAAVDAYRSGEIGYGEYEAAYNDYIAAVLSYYREYNAVIGEKLVELIRVRGALAAEAGFDSYEQMRYEFDFERDYTPEQALEFIAAVTEEILPLRERIESGIDRGAPDPGTADPEELSDCLEVISREMGGVFPDTFRFMSEYHLFDFSANENKTPMSFETYICDYEAPFLLISPTGSGSDVMTAIHEYGHYADSFVQYGAGETIDLSECFSQGLELLALDRLEESLGRERVTALGRLQVLDILDTYEQQCGFAEFEHRLYAIPAEELSVEKINDLFLETAQRFGYAEEGLEDYDAMFWIDIPHFFEQPFYVISYPVSLSVALQFYALENEREGTGREKYLEMLEHSSGNLLETLEEYGMDDPLDRDTVSAAADTIDSLFRRFR